VERIYFHFGFAIKASGTNSALRFLPAASGRFNGLRPKNQRFQTKRLRL